MADSELAALTEISLPLLTDLLYTVDTGGTTDSKLSVARAVGNWLPSTCEGRITTESGVAISTTDRTAQGTIYFALYKGNRVALYDGTRWTLYAFTERSLALTATSGKNYDVFLYDNAGTLTLELSAAWTTDVARADALTTQDGVPVKSGATTRRWLGTIRASAANVTADSATQRYVWNAYNQVIRSLRVVEATDSWSYATGTWRQTRATTTNKVEYVSGDASIVVTALVAFNCSVSGNTLNAASGVGLDSITAAPVGVYGTMYNAGASILLAGGSASYAGTPGLGYHYLSWMEYGAVTGTCVFYGDNGGDHLQSGLVAALTG